MSKSQKRKTKKLQSLKRSPIKTRNQRRTELVQTLNLNIRKQNIKDRPTPNLENCSQIQNSEMAESKLEAIIQHIPCYDGKKENNIKFFMD